MTWPGSKGWRSREPSFLSEAGRRNQGTHFPLGQEWEELSSGKNTESWGIRMGWAWTSGLPWGRGLRNVNGGGGVWNGGSIINLKVTSLADLIMNS